MLDLLIHGGTVYDGLGTPPTRRDVGIKDGRIALLGAGAGIPAREVRDATGLWLAPGFIDIHTHYDLELEVAPGLGESVRHGVTSVVMGNCSLSLTLGDPETLADIFLRVETLPAVLVRKWLAGAGGAETPAAYFEHLGKLALGPNVAALLGHSALRASVMGLERSLSQRASAAEIAAMRSLACAALDAGCIGISVDLVHWHRMSGRFAGRSIPSHHADLREYRMLADVCRERDAVFQVTPDPKNPLSVPMILRLATGLFRAPLRITLLSALDMEDHPQLWRVFPALAFVFNRVLGGNLRFQTLTEPFTIYADGPLTPVFEEFEAGVRLNNCVSEEERRALWHTPGFRAEFARDWRRSLPKTFHRDPARMRIVRAPDAALAGKTVADVARERARPALETLMDLLAEHDEALRWVATGANARPAVRQRLMAHPHILPGFTDAGAHCRNLAFYDGPLSLLRQAVQTGFMAPEQALRRVTGEPARWFNLDVGVLREGAQADLVLLDPDGLRTPIPEPIELPDATLDGALRMVKRGSERAVQSVFIAGREVAARGEPLAPLGRMRLGRQLSAPRIEGGAAAVHRRYRDRINDEIFEHPFRDYWDIFVLKHRNPANVALHGLGVLIFYGSLAAALLAQSPWWLLGVPVSQASGLLGHVLFERSYVDARDVVFSWRASRALNRLFASVLRGRYRAEIERVEAALRAHASEAPAGGRSEARSEAKPSVGGGPEAATSAEAR